MVTIKLDWKSVLLGGALWALTLVPMPTADASTSDEHAIANNTEKIAREMQYMRMLIERGCDQKPRPVVPVRHD